MLAALAVVAALVAAAESVVVAESAAAVALVVVAESVVAESAVAERVAGVVESMRGKAERFGLSPVQRLLRWQRAVSRSPLP